MTSPDTAGNRQSLFRIDRFECPVEHIGAFENRLAIIHGYFDTLDGCLYNRVAVALDGSSVKVATVVEWRDAEALQAAKTAVSAFYAKSGFNPARFLAEHGIVAEYGTYRLSALDDAVLA